MHTSRTTRNTLVFGQIRNVRGIRVGIAGLNSAWSAGEENQKGSLWLGGHWRIQHVRPEFEDTRFNIVLMHHAPGWFTDSETPALGACRT
uniref:Uncharacterized protein n=1 Tax=Candidatus Kentrum sp. DK TaxID=2126562 RepID=A0A450TGZ7_9GAMM|nr:MAG: hypothetical protein BECKDK2373C_GA0170839_11491 [Candidatus Kentron sp. DK]